MDEENTFYRILQSRSGEKVPAIILPSGDKPLHSLIDPKREAQKLISTITEETGFIIFLGLGGGFAVQEALEHTNAQLLVIDYNAAGLEYLFSNIDYSQIFKNERISLLIDPNTDKIKNYIAQHYKPALCGGIKTIPLRTRIEADFSKFETAVKFIQEAIDSVSGDYSVQAHFGKRWFSNIIRNLKAAETQPQSLGKPGAIKEIAIIAAGPSLDMQIPAVKEKKSNGAFIISSDTALPALLHNGIEPDAAVSIDCQHISFYHFMSCPSRNSVKNIPLFLDIASPPLLRDFSATPVFFSSAHPLALYISRSFKPLPSLDTSGGNVTYACLSLAEKLGAEQITLFGADFAYVNSSAYARGTYIYPYFDKKQNRLSPAQALLSTFLYRSPFLPAQKSEQSAPNKFYETGQLRFYREKLEEKAASMDAQIFSAQGMGAPINLPQKLARNTAAGRPFFNTENAAADSAAFLRQYSADVAALPKFTQNNAYNYLRALSEKETVIFTTLLPLCAAIKYRRVELKTSELIEEVKNYCTQEIAKVIRTSGVF